MKLFNALLFILITFSGVGAYASLVNVTVAEAQTCYETISNSSFGETCPEGNYQEKKCYVKNSNGSYSETPCPVPLTYTAGKSPICTENGIKITCPSSYVDRSGRGISFTPSNGRCYTIGTVSNRNGVEGKTATERVCTVVDYPEYQNEVQAAPQPVDEAEDPVCYDSTTKQVISPCPLVSSSRTRSTPQTLANGVCYNIALVSPTNSSSSFYTTDPAAGGGRVDCANAEQNAVDAAANVAVAGPQPTCESEGGAFSFIICPILTYTNDGIEWLDDRIINMLDVNPSYYEDGERLQQVWASIRNIAYILLIPIMLVMVISTALGFNFVDAYTVKRALPRLFVAVIFIALSFNIAVLMIEITSTVGRGIGGIIAAPFGGTEELTLQNTFAPPSDIGGNLLWGGILAFGGIYLLSSVSLPIIGSFLLVGFLALLIVFILLVLREMLLLFLVVMGPIAILSWIFPGNEKLWKLWWGTFTKLLYLFPIIVSLLIIGRAFAFMINETPTEENAVILTLIKLVAFIGPFFFIPKAFQMAGGVFANIAGIANNAERGIFDRQKKFRGEAKQQIKADTLAGNRFKNAPGLRRLNTTAQKMALQKEGGFSVGSARSAKIEAARTRNALGSMEEMIEKNQDYKAWKGDDDVNYAASMWAQKGKGDKASLEKELLEKDPTRFGNKQELDKTVAQIMAVRRSTGDAAFMQATALQAIAGGTAIKSDPGTNNAAGKAAKFVAGATRGDSSARANLVAKYRSAATNAGRMEQGMSGFGATMEAVSAFDAPDADMATINKNLMKNVIESLPPGHALHGKPESAGNIAMAHVTELQDIVQGIGGGTHTRADLSKHLASTMGLLDAMNSAAPQMAKKYQEGLLSASIVDPDTGTAMSVVDLAKSPTTLADPAFSQMRRDYAADQVRGAAAYEAAQVAARNSGFSSGMPQGPQGPQGPSFS
jgi:hypothetical protein